MFDKKIYARQYRLNHKEELSEKRKRYYQNHKEKDNETSKKYRQEHPNYISQWLINNPNYYREYNKEYRQTEEGKESHRRVNSKRYAREKEYINTLITQEWLEILEKYNYRCAYCGCEFDENTLPQKDHVIPISKGGHNTKENIVPACRDCNTRKNNKMIKDFQIVLSI